MTETTLLHRQIHPSWIQNDTVSSLAFEGTIASLSFMPSEKDDDKLSTYNGSKFTAEASFDHFSKTLQSAGVLSVTKGEVEAESLIVNEDNTPFNGHTIIDYSSITSKGQKKKKAQKLRNIALARGWQYKI